MTDECSVCYEPSRSVLECHIVCAGCTKLHFKQECPVCRKSHTLPVSGVPPASLVDHIDEDKKPEPRTLAEIYTEMRKKQKEQEKDVQDVEKNQGNRTDESSDDVDDSCDSEGDDYDL